MAERITAGGNDSGNRRSIRLGEKASESVNLGEPEPGQRLKYAEDQVNDFPQEEPFGADPRLDEVSGCNTGKGQEHGKTLKRRGTARVECVAVTQGTRDRESELKKSGNGRRGRRRRRQAGLLEGKSSERGSP